MANDARPSFDLREEERPLEPLGLKNPLRVAEPLGQSFLSPKFLSPLGAEALGGGDSLEGSAQTIPDYNPSDKLFQDSPFSAESRLSLSNPEPAVVAAATPTLGGDGDRVGIQRYPTETPVDNGQENHFSAVSDGFSVQRYPTEPPTAADSISDAGHSSERHDGVQPAVENPELAAEQSEQPRASDTTPFDPNVVQPRLAAEPLIQREIAIPEALEAAEPTDSSVSEPEPTLQTSESTQEPNAIANTNTSAMPLAEVTNIQPKPAPAPTSLPSLPTENLSGIESVTTSQLESSQVNQIEATQDTAQSTKNVDSFPVHPQEQEASSPPPVKSLHLTSQVSSQAPQTPQSLVQAKAADEPSPPNQPPSDPPKATDGSQTAFDIAPMSATNSISVQRSVPENSDREVVARRSLESPDSLSKAGSSPAVPSPAQSDVISVSEAQSASALAERSSGSSHDHPPQAATEELAVGSLPEPNLTPSNQTVVQAFSETDSSALSQTPSPEASAPIETSLLRQPEADLSSSLGESVAQSSTQSAQPELEAATPSFYPSQQELLQATETFKSNTDAAPTEAHPVQPRLEQEPSNQGMLSENSPNLTPEILTKAPASVQGKEEPDSPPHTPDSPPHEKMTEAGLGEGSNSSSINQQYPQSDAALAPTTDAAANQELFVSPQPTVRESPESTVEATPVAEPHLTIAQPFSETKFSATSEVASSQGNEPSVQLKPTTPTGTHEQIQLSEPTEASLNQPVSISEPTADTEGEAIAQSDPAPAIPQGESLVQRQPLAQTDIQAPSSLPPTPESTAFPQATEASPPEPEATVETTAQTLTVSPATEGEALAQSNPAPAIPQGEPLVQRQSLAQTDLETTSAVPPTPESTAFPQATEASSPELEATVDPTAKVVSPAPEGEAIAQSNTAPPIPQGEPLVQRQPLAQTDVPTTSSVPPTQEDVALPQAPEASSPELEATVDPTAPTALSDTEGDAIAQSNPAPPVPQGESLVQRQPLLETAPLENSSVPPVSQTEPPSTISEPITTDSASVIPKAIPRETQPASFPTQQQPLQEIETSQSDSNISLTEPTLVQPLLESDTKLQPEISLTAPNVDAAETNSPPTSSISPPTSAIPAIATNLVQRKAIADESLDQNQEVPQLPTVLENLVGTRHALPLVQPLSQQSQFLSTASTAESSTERSAILQKMPEISPRDTAQNAAPLTSPEETFNKAAKPTVQVPPVSLNTEPLVLRRFATDASPRTAPEPNQQNQLVGSSTSTRDIPNSWSSIADLLSQTTTNSSSAFGGETPIQMAFDDSRDQAPFDWQESNSWERIIPESSHSADSSSSFSQETPIQRFTPEETPPDEEVSSAEHPSKHEDSKNEDSKNLEMLAWEIYGLVRQRLEIERERHGNYSSNRLPW